MPTAKKTKAPEPSSGWSAASKHIGAIASGNLLRVQRAACGWTWMIDPGRLGCRNGRIVPLPIKAPWQPGLLSNNRAPDQGAGAVAEFSRPAYGMVPIPHDRPATAWGKPREPSEGDALSTYVVPMDAVSGGRNVIHHVDAWTRPTLVGSHIEWKHDRDGRDAFLAQALLDLGTNGTGKLSEAQIHLATAPAIHKLDQLSMQDSRNAAREYVRQAAHIPPEHLPAEHKRRVEELTAEAVKAS